MNTEKLRAKVAEYQKQREQFLENAQQQLAALDGAIQALQGLVTETEEEEEEEEDCLEP